MPAAKKATNHVETLVEDAQKSAAETFETFSKSMEKAVAFTQDNVDAMTKSAEIAAKATEEMNAQLMAFTKKSVEEGVAASKTLSEVKSIPALVEKQSEMVKVAFDGYVAETTKLSEMAMSAMKEVFAPMNARAEAAQDFAKTMRA